MEIDYIILGQGICGTFLSWYLINAEKKVIVIDDALPFTSSKIASGLINPVTGRRIVTTWMIDDLLPFARNAYRSLGSELGCTLAHDYPLIDFHPTLQMKEAFMARCIEDNQYLALIEDEEAWKDHFNFHYGLGMINQCIVVDMPEMLEKWRKVLTEKNCLIEQKFNWADCTIDPVGVKYAGILASKIICCDGASGFYNPYFRQLPFSSVKGEVLIASIPGLPHRFTYKQGITIVPWKDDLFWIGSSYEWNYNNTDPTPAFKARVESQLKGWLKHDFKILDHWASERPANIERRPFVGLHPLNPAVGILNGMGSKGCSLAPYFAAQLADHLSGKGTILPEADIARHTKILTR